MTFSDDAEGNLVGEGDFPAQYEKTLKNIEVVLKTGGARPADIVRMTIYCTDRDAFYTHGKEVGQIYKPKGG